MTFTSGNKLHYLYGKKDTRLSLQLIDTKTENTQPTDQQDATLRTGKIWVSSTPYLLPWHIRRGYLLEEQIERECALRQHPVPMRVDTIDTIMIKGRVRRPVHFHRFRNKKINHQPDRRGCFLRLEFAEPVSGPLAFGFACHYGLGQFRCEG